MTALQPKMILGGDRYELVSCLGEGGQAQVWEARQAGIGGFSKSVVLKILEFDERLEKQRDLLLHEARIAARLQHPNLVSIFEINEAPPYLYFAMEYIQGFDLNGLLGHVAEKIGKRQLPWSVALAIFRQVCHGLYHAHNAKGSDDQPLCLVHRDLKPNNLLIGHNGIVKIIDFGIAKSTAKAHKTQTGMIRGTPAYMSPEQIQSKPLDARSDLYSLGVLLYEMSAGLNPFASPDTFTTMMQVIQLTPPPLRQHLPQAPPELEELLTHLLHKAPEARPTNARDLYRQSERILRQYQCRYEADDIAEWLAAFERDPTQAFARFGLAANPRETILDPMTSVTTDPVALAEHLKEAAKQRPDLAHLQHDSPFAALQSPPPRLALSIDDPFAQATMTHLSAFRDDEQEPSQTNPHTPPPSQTEERHTEKNNEPPAPAPPLSISSSPTEGDIPILTARIAPKDTLPLSAFSSDDLVAWEDPQAATFVGTYPASPSSSKPIPRLFWILILSSLSFVLLALWYLLK